MTEYRVALDVYHGPMDLLLFLIRREEIEIHDIPIARITAQYLEYVNLLKALDPEAVSEFLVLAATLIEIKSRTLLPHPPAEEEDDTFVDPRSELVRQLLEYKKFKDAARSLEESAGDQKRRHAREPAELVPEKDEYELDNLEIWDLFDAFRNLLDQITAGPPVHEVGVDDTPLALHAEDISDSLQRAGGTQPFAEVFAGRTRAEMIGLFLALLELIRQRRVRASQDVPFGPILLHLLDATPLGEIQDDYEGAVDSGDEVMARPGDDDGDAVDDDVVELDSGDFEDLDDELIDLGAIEAKPTDASPADGTGTEARPTGTDGTGTEARPTGEAQSEPRAPARGLSTDPEPRASARAADRNPADDGNSTDAPAPNDESAVAESPGWSSPPVSRRADEVEHRGSTDDEESEAFDEEEITEEDDDVRE